MLALAITGFAAQAHAVTFDDLLQEVNNLKQQVLDLRTQLGAAVSRATMSATSYQSASTLKTSDVSATLQQATSGTGGTVSPTTGTGTSGGSTSGTGGGWTTGGQAISVKTTFDAEAGLDIPDIEDNKLTKPEVPTSYIVSQQPSIVTAPGTTFTRTIAIGERSNDVKKLQDILVSKGYLSADNATGLYGKVTAAAVMALQRANGIIDDGTIVGPKTQAILNGGVGAQAQIPSGTGTPASGIFPPGCTSFNGYSTVNGQPCSANLQPAQIGWVCQFNPNAAPKLKVTSPNGGEVFAAGQQITVTWKTCSIPTTAYVDIFLTMPGINQGVNLTHTLNDGSQVVTLPSTSTWGQMVYGQNYKITIVGAATDASDNLFTINATQQACTLNSPYMMTASTTASQYVAAGSNGVTDAAKVTYNFTSNGGTATITELKILSTTINSARVGNVSAPTVGGVTWLQGLNIQVPVGGAGTNVDVYLSYPAVGITGVVSGTYATIVPSYVKYTCGGIVSTITSFPNLNDSPKMRLVGSKPAVGVPTTSNAGLVLTTENKIGQVDISANVQGNIAINQIKFNVGTSGINGFGLSSPRIADGTTTIAGSSCSVGGGSTTVTCTFSSGYTIAAGSTKSFNLYSTVLGTTILNSFTSVATSLSSAGFLWTDIAGNGATGAQSGTWIYNFPTGSYSIHQ